MADDSRFFDLEIITPDRVFWSGKASMLEMNTTEGQVGIYKKHIPMTMILQPGIVKLHLDRPEPGEGSRTARRAAAAGTRPEDQYVQSRTGAETGAGTAGAGREIKFKNYLDRTKVLIYTQDCNRTKVHERVIGISVTQRAGLNLTVIQKYV